MWIQLRPMLAESSQRQALERILCLQAIVIALALG